MWGRWVVRGGLVVVAAWELYGAAATLDYRYALLGMTLLGFVIFSVIAARREH